MRWLPVLPLLGLLSGCAGGEPPTQPTQRTNTQTTATRATTQPTTTMTPLSPSDVPSPAATGPIPRWVTPDDDGAAFTMALGSTATLRVPLPGRGDPVVTGDAVLVIPILNVAPGNAREWEIRAVSAGTSTVRGSSPDFVFTITVS